MRETLDKAAARINTPSFIAADPVQFPRRFSRQPDIEIVALLVSHISWGRREMILRDAERLLVLMGGEPREWLMDGRYEEVDDRLNIHRTFFGSSLKHFCRGLRSIYGGFATLEECARHGHIEASEQPAWELAAIVNRHIELAAQGRRNAYCLPQNLDTTALKRLNMALRWLVRDDGLVDLGVWRLLRPSQLFIPLDVHVGNTARSLGLLTRASNDRRAVVELTERLREMRPDDPCYYDFALFGLGIENKR